jgi:hypothetical protein
MRIPAVFLAAACAVVLSACGGGERGEELAEAVQQAVSDSYGWPTEPALANITGFDGRDAPDITVITNLSDTPENRVFAQDLCMTVASVGITVPDFEDVFVTAGEGGAFLAECEAVR